MLRNVQTDSVETRFEEWVQRLETQRSEYLEAQHLYAGDHWTVSRELVRAAAVSGLKARLWIISAGYGLITPTKQIKPYTATFSNRHPDSVSPNGDSELYGRCANKWWELLSGWKGLTSQTPRSLSQLASEEPHVSMLVVASPPYLRALRSDLRAVLGNLHRPDDLCVVSPDVDYMGQLSLNVIPCNGRLKSLLGGSMVSLNARLARRILLEANHWPLQASVLKERYNCLLASQAPQLAYNRQRMDDASVREYITAALMKNWTKSPYPLLRQLRDEGYACEQARFSVLFHEVRGKLHAS